jgi:hypothetical protein
VTHIVASKIRALHDVRFNRQVGAMLVKRVGNTLVLDHKDPGLVIARWDVVWVPLPPEIKIVCEGRYIQPFTRFWITVESFDPYHLVCDRPEPQ